MDEANLNYRPRLIDRKIKEYLDIFGAVLIQGPKWCGKTWTATHHAKSLFDVSDPAANFRNKQMALLDPASVLVGDSPRCLDEWQEVPALWDAVRHTVDARSEKGCFILTGSSTPDDTATLHSGAGRFGRIRMHTLSLAESGESSAVISFAELFDNAPLSAQKSATSLQTLAHSIVRGGWPGALDFTESQAIESARTYLETMAQVDLSKIDGIKRDPEKARALINSLARNNATNATIETLRADIEAFSTTSLSLPTLREYLSLFKRLFLLDEIPAWEPAFRTSAHLRKAPKRILTDPSLACAALGMSVDGLLSDLKTFGFMFEALALRDLQIYAEQTRTKIAHYRDDAGLEIDAIVQAENGTWGALEIKLGIGQIDKAATNLLKLKKKMEGKVQTTPAFLGIIVGAGGFAHTRADGIHIIPLDCLGS
jgi:predicted AAA+ superfamily ATPase